jgi:hypothetical protein
MTKEDIIKLAREACDQAPREDWNSTAWVFGDETLERFAALVATAEREACAALCDVAVENFTSISLQVNDEDGIVMEHANTCSHLAAAIRARGKP